MIGVGYMMYPHVIPAQKEVTPIKERKITLANGRTITVDITSIQAQDFPEMVTLLNAVTLGNSLKTDVPKGSEVKPLKIKGDKLTVKDVELNIEGVIALSDTDFEDRALKKMAENFENMGKPAVPAGPTPDQIAAQKAQAEAEAKAEELASLKAEMEAAAAAKAEEAAAIAEAEAEAAAKVLSPEQIETLMKSYLTETPLTEFQVGQVTEFKAGDKEIVDGIEYQTGTASYNMETIFGKRSLSAKALIEKGVLKKWISPKSGLQLQ